MTVPVLDNAVAPERSISVVLDHPHRHVARRLMRRVSGLAGAMLLLLGLTASIAAVPTCIAVLGFAIVWIDGDEADRWPPGDVPVRPILLVWSVTMPLAIVGTRGGLSLLRRNRKLVLFLRRFGHDEAQSAVTFAVLETIGASWRVVTLDDAEMAPIGVPDMARRAFHFGSVTSRHVLAIGHFAGARMFPVLTLAMWAVLALALLGPAIEFAQTGRARWEEWAAAMTPYLEVVDAVLERRLPFDAATGPLSGVFALLAVAAAVSFGVLMATMAALVLAMPLSAVLFFLSSSADAVRQAERSKTAVVNTLPEIRHAAWTIADRSRKVFGPRLVVLRVASTVWQQAVIELASVSSLLLIDISEPTENVAWELEELRRRFGRRCLIVGQHDRVLALMGKAPYGAPAAVERRMADLLEGGEILAYTTDRSGLRRFAHALRAMLLSRQSE